MRPSATFKTLITAAPYFNPELLFKRANVQCGNIASGYDYAGAPVPPTCSGSQTVCTFTNSLQGCCDTSGNCQFYNSCNPYASSASSCTGGCLQCQSSAPFCTTWNFYNSANPASYAGYSCGPNSVSAVIQGVVASSGATAAGNTATSVTTSPAGSVMSSKTGTTATGGSSSSSSSSSTVSSAAATSTGSSTKSLSGGVIAGIVIGVLVVILIVVGGVIYCRRSQRKKTISTTPPTRENHGMFQNGVAGVAEK